MASYIAQSPKLSQGIWENPCLSIFNHVCIDQFRRSKKAGDVKPLLDNHLGKRVFSIRGLISLNSFIEIPNPDAPDELSREPINAAGPFIYVQYRRVPASSNTPIDKSHVIFHFDILTNNGPLRLSVSSMFDEIKMAGHALRIPLNPCNDGRWTIFALDIPKLLGSYVSRNSEYKLLRSVKLCASMVVRDVFTSHQAFTFTNVPSDMKLPCRSSEWDEEYSWLWCPEPPVETHLSHSPMRIESARPSVTPSPTFKQPRSIIDHSVATKLPLTQVLGVGVTGTGNLCWRGDRVLFPGAQSLVMFYSNSITSLCCHHSATITSTHFSNNATLMLSAQDDGVVSMWDIGEGRCFWRDKSMSLVTCAFSACDEFVVIVTKDSQQRSVISMWNVQAMTLRKQGLVSRQTVELHVNRVIFMPNDNTRFISCGMENIRHWRLNKEKLQGSSCIADAGRGVHFTDLSFKQGGDTLLATTTSGKLFLVDVIGRKVTDSFQVHDSSISCIATAGNCVITGDSQGYLRAWATDSNFVEYLVQARYESGILSMAVNQDASKVVTATSHGCLGVLDLASQKYSSLLQCHRTGINAIATSGTQIVTCGFDSTLRLVEEGVQQAEFHIDKDAPTAVSISPTVEGARWVACGYASGVVRVVAASSSSSLYEKHEQRGQIIQLVYSRTGTVLYSLDNRSSLVLYEATNEFKMIKSLTLKQGSFYIAANDDGSIAVVSCVKEAYSLEVLDHLSQPFCSLELPAKCKPLKLIFSSHRRGPPCLLVLTTRCLLKYDILNTKMDSVKGQVVFRMSAEDVAVAELSEAGVVWLDPKTSHLLVRSARGELFKLAHPPSKIGALSLSLEAVVAANETGSLLVWERSMRSSALQESFEQAMSFSNTDITASSDSHVNKEDTGVGETSFQSVESIDVSCVTLPKCCPEVDSPRLKVRRVLGYEDGSCENIVWDSVHGVVLYSVGHLLVLTSISDPDKQAVGTPSLHINTISMCGDKVLVGCAASTLSACASFSVWKCDEKLGSETVPCLSLVHSFHLHDETGVEALAVSPCHTCSISLGAWSDIMHCTVMIIWSKVFKMISSHQMATKINGVSFFPSCNKEEVNNEVHFATVCREDGVVMWMLDKSDKQLHERGRISTKDALSVSVINNNFLMYGDCRGCLNVWSFGEEKIVECSEVGSQGVTSITSSCGHVFASTLCGTVKSFETSTGHLKCTSSQSFGSAIISLAQEHTSGMACLVGSRDGSLFVMSDKKHEQVLRIAGGGLTEGTASHLKFMGGGRLLLSIGDDGSLRCWDSDLNRTVFHLQTMETSKCVACAVGGSSSSHMWCAISCQATQDKSARVRVFDLINVTLENEFAPSSAVTHMCALGGNLLCACVDGSLVLVKLNGASHQMYEVSGPSPDMVFHKLAYCEDHHLVYALAVSATTGDSHMILWDITDEGILSLQSDIMLLGDIQDVIICPWDIYSLVVVSANSSGHCSVELHHQPNSPYAEQSPVSIQLDCFVSSMVNYSGLVAIGTAQGGVKLLNSELEIVADCSPHLSQNVSLEVAGSRLASYNNTQIITWEVPGDV